MRADTRRWAATLLGLGGVLATVAASYAGLVVLPDAQTSVLGPVELGDGGAPYPEPEWGFAEPGRRVYVSLGCIYCHSQQVRQNDFGGDISRGWGARASVPLDYIHEDPPLLGTMRTGPDLRNIGVRQPSEAWHYLHLYNPQIVSEGSIMPPFPFLFREVDRAEHPGRPRDALDLPEDHAVEGKWVVPTREARALVEYLVRSRRDVPLPEGASSPPDPAESDRAPAREGGDA